MTIEMSPAVAAEYVPEKRVPSAQDWADAAAWVDLVNPEVPREMPIAPMARTFTPTGAGASLARVLDAAGFEDKPLVSAPSYRQTLAHHGVEAVRDVLALGSERFMGIRNIGAMAVDEVAQAIAFAVPSTRWRAKPPMAEIARLYESLDELPVNVVTIRRAISGLSVSQMLAETPRRLAQYVAGSEHYTDDQLDGMVYTQCLARDFAKKFHAAKRRQSRA